MSRPERITVVGGGIGGVTAATALAQAGFAVTLLEAAPAFGDIGAGVTLSPNAMKGFDHIGVPKGFKNLLVADCGFLQGAFRRRNSVRFDPLRAPAFSIDQSAITLECLQREGTQVG